MNFLITIFNETIFKPIFNLLMFVVDVMPGHSFGVAIILVTLFIRFILYPLSYKALKSQRELSKVQPEIKKIQKKHKNNKQEQSAAIMKLYKEHDINPFAGCIPFLIQIPIIIGLYRVFLVELVPDKISELLYPFIAVPDQINTAFFGLGDLTHIGQLSIAFGVMAGVAQFFLSKLTMAQKDKTGMPKANDGKPDLQNIMGKQMTYVLPVITVFIAMRFPAGLGLYWFVTTLFSIGQQYVINKKVG